MADLARTEGLLRAQLLVGTEVVDSWEAPAETLNRSREAPPILVALPAAPGEPPRALDLVFGSRRRCTRSSWPGAQRLKRYSRSIVRTAPWSALLAPVPDLVLAVLAVGRRGLVVRGGYQAGRAPAPGGAGGGGGRSVGAGGPQGQG